MMEQLRIGEVAARAGLRTSAIRYYEQIGLLPEARRLNGRRRYAANVLDHLAVIRMAQEAGFTVAEIRNLFHGFPGDAPASLRWRSLAERKIVEVDAMIARATRMRAVLAESLRCGCLTFDQCAAIGWDSPGTSSARSG
jgi:MerR family redox-sensitive transcriptional activator SoxR